MRGRRIGARWRGRAGAVVAGALLLALGASIASRVLRADGRPPGPRTTGLAPLYVSPTGSDAAPCRRARPCRTLGAVFRRARAGQAIELLSGSYPAQRIGVARRRSAAHVVIRPAAGASVSLTGRLTLAGAAHLTLERLRLARPREPDRSLFIEPCTTDVTLRGVQGKTFFVMEGTRGISFRGGRWGGYATPGDEDSAIGTTGAQGPTATCGDRPAGPARDIAFLGVTFEDVFWDVPESEWGASHPDCFEVNGFVDGLTIRGSRFRRCASTFMQINGDQGDMRRLRFARNSFSQLGSDTYYGIQITSEGKPGKCGGVVFDHNTYLPGSPRARTWPNGPIRTDCEPLAGSPPMLVTRNVFTRAPPGTECRRYVRAPYRARWVDNLFASGSCGTGTHVPYGYRLGAGGLRADAPAAGTVRRAFALAAGGRSAAGVAAALNRDRRRGARRWSAGTVRRVVADAVYRGGRYGARGANPALVASSTWLAAQGAVRR